MKEDSKLRALDTNEMVSFYGGGYWITERVDGVLKTFWVEDGN